MPKEVEEDLRETGSYEDVHKSDPRSDALARLFWDGCDPAKILSLLHAYCEPLDPDDYRQKPDALLRGLAKLSRDLQKSADAIEELPPIVRVNPRLARDLTKASGQLKRFYDMSLEGDMPRGQQAATLVAAVGMVKLASGRPHYGELAELVSMLGDKQTEPATLRMIVKNFKRRNEFPFLTDDDIRRQVKWSQAKWKRLRAALQSSPPKR